MEKLNRKLLTNGFAFEDSLVIGNRETLPEKVIQFGEGNFLRAFVDYMFDALNAEGKFGGGITLVQPIPGGDMIRDFINEQDGLYTLIARGQENGEKVVSKRLITSVNRCINPYVDFDEYNKCAENPELRYVVSNTTEAGIAYKPEPMQEDKPQDTFPAKVTNFLYRRFKAFDGDSSKGLVFIPCELIDDNGKTLKKYVLKYAEDWKLGEGFVDWIENACIFTSTLVDRIVTGYPRNEADALKEEFGYIDNVVDTSEIFHTWVIEGPKELENELPFDKIGLNVIFTPDVKPYKKRKVRILNGAHTCSVLGAYIAGETIVRKMMGDPVYHTYLEKALNDEVMPALTDLDKDDLQAFTDAVFDRFQNPYIDHKILDISLNSTSKFRARVLPTIKEYLELKGKLPKILTFSFAAYVAFYNGTELRNGALIGHRNGSEEYEIKDDAAVLEKYAKLNSENDRTTKEGCEAIIKTVCADTDFWGEDLNAVPDFAKLCADYLYKLSTTAPKAVIEEVIQ